MRFLNPLLLISVMSALSVMPQAAFGACPDANSRAYRETREGNERTVHCRCIAGYENREGKCVKVTNRGGRGVEENIKDAAANWNSCILPPTGPLETDKVYFYMYFTVRQNCPKKTPIPVFIGVWRGKSCQPLGTFNDATPGNPAKALIAPVSEKLVGVTYTWTTKGRPCDERLKKIPLDVQY